MAEAPIQRVSPLTVYEWQRPLALSTGPGITRPDGTVVRLGAQELVTTSDEGRVWRGDGTYLGGTVDHGPVANATAMSVIWLQPSCTRGVHPGDTCWRSDLGVEYRVISGHNATAVWRAVGAGNAAVAGAQPLNATLTSIAGQGASTWGLARLLDSGAPAAKGALGIQRADIGDSSAAGRALLGVAAPSEASVPVIALDGTVTTTPLSDLGGGGGGGWTESSTGPSNAGQGGLASATNPSGASISVVVTPSATGYKVDWTWSYTGPNVYWIIRIGSTAGLADIYQTSGTQTSNAGGSVTITSTAVGYLQLIVQHTTGGSVLTTVNLTCEAGITLPIGAAGWMTDGAGHFVPYYA